MNYLIDGYNLFFGTQKEWNDFSEQREAFVKTLDEVAARLHFRAHLIFDGRNEAAFSSKRKLKQIDVSFSPGDLSADQYLLELLRWNPRTTTLVTSDRDLLKKGKNLGAKTLSAKKFIAFISEKKKTELSRKKEIVFQSTVDIEHLRIAFEKKLRESDTSSGKE